MYSRLSPLSADIIATLLAARRGLSQTQLQELLAASHVSFIQSLQQLHQSNIIERSAGADGNAVYQVGSLVLDYLSRFHPPSDSFVRKTRTKIQRWQVEQDRSALDRRTYRYARNSISIETDDQRISAPHLRSALNLTSASDFAEAHKCVIRAKELTPQWWEIHRIRAHVLEKERRPIYEIEQAFEDSINCKDTDVNRFHYAVYLMGTADFHRALRQIEYAAAHDTADTVSLRSIKGLILMRSGLIPEALEELEYVWNDKNASVPMNIKRIHGTQFANGLRRRVEQLYSLGDSNQAKKCGLKGLQVTCVTAETCAWDWKLAEVGIQLLAEMIGREDDLKAHEREFIEIASAWDSNTQFRAAFQQACRNRRKLQRLFERSIHAHRAMPSIHVERLAAHLAHQPA